MTGLTENEKIKLEAIFKKYCRLMKYIALKNLNNDSAAEDAVQNAVIKLMHYLDKIEDIDSAKTRALISLITENESRDLLRREKALYLREQKVRDNQRTFGKETVPDSFKGETEVAAILSEMPTKYRDVLMLKVYFSFTDKEIAACLGITGVGARKRIERARKYAVKILEEGENSNENDR
ncbi:MAG: sigma-70 family RNA polymerase sigma factor [Clostridia bacterium]|nr:sigma-70 family RNA polymerase sigma factor [Clostridia bacterium]